eukprot:TRINITY_DN15342_c0_g1_i1.p1 TRINITY_DN15342_c0_g1~~TRINITY_DN15342_c0_g1_i1.p1  ORF type:complete len:164 (-),score=41.28 TRINITY_DN15342_c0_g1_i1:181-630(-)
MNNIIRTNRQTNSPEDIPSPALLKAAADLNEFLKAFVDETGDYKRTWLRRASPNRYLGVPPDMTQQKNTIFMTDESFRFSSVMFWGIEWELVLWNMLCFATFYLWFDSASLGAVMTLTLEYILIFFRKRWGRINISNKSLVQERFMLTR